MSKICFLMLSSTALYNDVDKLNKFIESGHTNDVDTTGSSFLLY